MLKNNRNTFWASPVFRTFISFAVIFVGLFGSLYSDEIKKALPKFLTGLSSQSIVTIFWTSLVISLFCYFKSYRAGQQNQEKIVDDLNETIASLPPENFLEEYTDSCHFSYLIVREVKDRYSSLSKIQVEAAVQEILRVIINLVKYYWKEVPKNTIYAANVMLSMPSSPNAQVDFSPPAFAPQDLECLLKLRKELSASTKDHTGPDGVVHEVCLPVYKTAAKRVLPGAPAAFVANETVAVPDTKKWKEWLKGIDDFDASVKNQVVAYFETGHGKDVNAFVSIPLTDHITGTVFGVLNIHSNEIGPWENQRKNIELRLMISPFIDHLSDVITIWKTK